MLWNLKVTVIKRTCNEDLCREYGAEEFLKAGGSKPCGAFRDGQEFLVNASLDKPTGFCSSAWADIRHELFAIVHGGDRPYIAPKGTAIACCTDGMKPVVFKIERVGDAPLA
jgi:uncharacterized repeat protein (TIGR04076 family)